MAFVFCLQIRQGTQKCSLWLVCVVASFVIATFLLLISFFFSFFKIILFLFLFFKVSLTIWIRKSAVLARPNLANLLLPLKCLLLGGGVAYINQALFEPANSPPSINWGNKARAVVRNDTCGWGGCAVALQLILTYIFLTTTPRRDWENHECFESWGTGICHRSPPHIEVSCFLWR